jgi:hypothetical protein
MEYFVGFKIERDHFIGSIFIHQTQYITGIIKCFEIGSANIVNILADTHSKLSKRMDLVDHEVQVPYKEVVGCCMYAQFLTRPDISYASSLVAKFQAKPKQSH